MVRLSEPSAPSTWRLFVAHPVPPTARAMLQGQLAPYRARYRDVRWTPPETWHLTLVFLGPVRVARVPELIAVVDRVAARHAPYLAAAVLGDGRLRRGEGVAWVGLEAGAVELAGIARGVADACPPGIAESGAPRPALSAHLTVARRASGGLIDGLRQQALGPLAVEWRVDRLVLVRSHLSPGGARYETLHEATL